MNVPLPSMTGLVKRARANEGEDRDDRVYAIATIVAAVTSWRFGKPIVLL